MSETVLASSKPENLPSIPGVELQGLIGRGGMGVVYRGMHGFLGREVAVKLLTELCHGDSKTQFSARFQREAKILAAMTHPNIVACYDGGTLESGQCYLVMEFIDGQNLRQWLDAHGPLSAAQALRVTRILAEALEYAHQRRIIHRDIKVENVLLRQDCSAPAEDPFPFQVKLVDLGLARSTSEANPEAQITVQGEFSGTPQVMAPEQFEDYANVDHRADIYGLGCLLYHALTGKCAYTGRTWLDVLSKKKAGPTPDPREHRKEIPSNVADLVRELMAPRAEDRPQSYGQVLSRLDALLVEHEDTATRIRKSNVLKTRRPAEVEVSPTGATRTLKASTPKPAGKRGLWPWILAGVLIDGAAAAVVITVKPFQPVENSKDGREGNSTDAISDGKTDTAKLLAVSGPPQHLFVPDCQTAKDCLENWSEKEGEGIFSKPEGRYILFHEPDGFSSRAYRLQPATFLLEGVFGPLIVGERSLRLGPAEAGVRIDLENGERLVLGLVPASGSQKDTLYRAGVRVERRTPGGPWEGQPLGDSRNGEWAHDDKKHGPGLEDRMLHVAFRIHWDGKLKTILLQWGSATDKEESWTRATYVTSSPPTRLWILVDRGSACFADFRLSPLADK
jgi:serine/threonine protein kinase